MIEWLGKFHPLWVHLPIGMLVLAATLKLLSMRRRWEKLNEILPIILAITFISSVFTCISGYLLSLAGGYDAKMVGQHQWAGILLTGLVGIAYFLVRKDLNRYFDYSVWTVLVILIGITGHLGGSLTHGEDFLSFPKTKEKSTKTIADISKAKAYEAVVAPILEEKCLGCHSSKKKKGELRLDSPEMIRMGGENGAILKAHANESEFYKRLILPELDKNHMPPKGKPQLTENEIRILEWWVNAGSDFEKTTGELKPEGPVLAILKSLEGGQEKKAVANFPEKPVKQADEAVLTALRSTGVSIVPIGLNSNYLSVNFLEKKNIGPETWERLTKIKDQLVWLKLDNTNIKDADLANIGRLINLHELHLNGATVGDNGVKALGSLTNLQLLNLTQTQVTEKGLIHLKNLKKLGHLYLFGSKVKPESWQELKGSFKAVEIDTGGYKNWFVPDSLLKQTVVVN